MLEVIRSPDSSMTAAASGYTGTPLPVPFSLPQLTWPNLNPFNQTQAPLLRETGTEGQSSTAVPPTTSGIAPGLPALVPPSTYEPAPTPAPAPSPAAAGEQVLYGESWSAGSSGGAEAAPLATARVDRLDQPFGAEQQGSGARASSDAVMDASRSGSSSSGSSSSGGAGVQRAEIMVDDEGSEVQDTTRTLLDQLWLPRPSSGAAVADPGGGSSGESNDSQEPESGSFSQLGSFLSGLPAIPPFPALPSMPSHLPSLPGLPSLPQAPDLGWLVTPLLTSGDAVREAVDALLALLSDERGRVGLGALALGGVGIGALVLLGPGKGDLEEAGDGTTTMAAGSPVPAATAASPLLGIPPSPSPSVSTSARPPSPLRDVVGSAGGKPGRLQDPKLKTLLLDNGPPPLPPPAPLQPPATLRPLQQLQRGPPLSQVTLGGPKAPPSAGPSRGAVAGIGGTPRHSGASEALEPGGSGSGSSAGGVLWQRGPAITEAPATPSPSSSTVEGRPGGTGPRMVLWERWGPAAGAGPPGSDPPGSVSGQGGRAFAPGYGLVVVARHGLLGVRYTP